MIKYSIAMGIRMVCIVALLVVPDWWKLIPAIGAVFLPYFAVVLANVSPQPAGEIERPGHIVVANQFMPAPHQRETGGRPE